MRVAVASIAGAPGVSVFVAALACASSEPLLVVEAAPSGGVIVPRWGWQPPAVTTPNLAISGDVLDLRTAARPWIGGASVIVGSPSSTAMSSDKLTAWLTRQVAATAEPLVVDLGRLVSTSSRLDLLGAFDEVWFVLDGEIAELTALREWARPLASWSITCRLLVRDGAPWSNTEIAETVGIPVAGRIPDDRRAAAALSGRAALSPWVVRRSALVRAAVPWAERITTSVEVPA